MCQVPGQDAHWWSMVNTIMSRQSMNKQKTDPQGLEETGLGLIFEKVSG